MDNSKPIRILIIDGKLICGGVESFLMNIYRHLDRERWKSQYNNVVFRTK